MNPPERLSKKPIPTSGSLGNSASLSVLSEINDHEDDFLNVCFQNFSFFNISVQISKKLQEKDEEIDNLYQQMRNLEKSAKKAQIEVPEIFNFQARAL